MALKATRVLVVMVLVPALMQLSQALNIVQLRRIAAKNNVTLMLVFGDSSVDPGNNNRLATTTKGNFLPYGKNFFNGRPTGRFTDGRLATDFIGKTFFTYLYAYSGFIISIQVASIKLIAIAIPLFHCKSGSIMTPTLLSSLAYMLNFFGKNSIFLNKYILQHHTFSRSLLKIFLVVRFLSMVCYLNFPAKNLFVSTIYIYKSLLIYITF